MLVCAVHGILNILKEYASCIKVDIELVRFVNESLGLCRLKLYDW